MIIIKTVFDGKKMREKMRQLKDELPDAVAKEAYTMAQYSRDIAAQLVPKDTGDTQRGILTVITVRTKNKVEVEVGFQRNPHPEKAPFNLPSWMTFSEAALQHPWRNGKDPEFLWRAKEMTEEKFGNQVGIAIRRVIQKRGK